MLNVPPLQSVYRVAMVRMRQRDTPPSRAAAYAETDPKETAQTIVLLKNCQDCAMHQKDLTFNSDALK
ncbi:hypothetical protein E4F39_11195 [Burkholderia pseudomallei]|nr:hypothetical protein [Burkholderia pseudomallei]MPT73762.1 hypothetical protein [Burkholderia pseudomallei]MPT75936.1 hypothetical protein [Burkholderia pseudomallei]MPT84024.1 hypothetical protein [Burkholderia pseudomallei]MPT90355.1 hypothetical protein [Burkholderia pseudomallei]